MLPARSHSSFAYFGRRQKTAAGGPFEKGDAARFLVERGAKVNVVNARGQTPWRVTQGEYRSGSYYADKPTGEYLVQAGADTTLGKDLGRESVSRQR